jgi:hypothetical protein
MNNKKINSLINNLPCYLHMVIISLLISDGYLERFSSTGTAL